MTDILYIQQVKRLCDDFFSTNGYYPGMFVQTFGCQMNDRESEKLQGLLLTMGYKEACNEEEADLVIYNTCCVRENAEKRVYGKLGYLKSCKTKQPNKVIVLCGCMPQREEVLTEINRSYRHVDIVFGTFNKHHFPRLLFEHLTQHKRVIEVLESHIEDEEYSINEFDSQTTRFSPHKAGVTVMHGCDNYCSYCIVPYVRGREKSRSPEEILMEINALVSDGVKEIMLLGQNVNSYGQGLHNPISFAELLTLISEVPGLRRIRFMTSHPKDLSIELIEAIKNCNKVCKHIHLPIQSGSNRILEAMNRGYTGKQYLELLERIRAAIPGIAITTDIIVGFPGEEETDFSDTLEIIQQANFTGAYTFMYSPRKGTPAADLMNEVPKEIIKERFNRLVEAINALQSTHNKKYLNSTVEIMVEDKSDKLKCFTGRTDDNVLVHFESEKDLTPGDLVHVKITGYKTFYMIGDYITTLNR
ncbi:MAG: tRNA (N6-isopentenyl adenosine(37)-C2)-methylthiotransferase MiaB [Defluviitaleaceae bacterium]|nr:tRNA (N6-isopentenyl adenosine(37)-C2)-methylthiotransferase MiaB [Defluviitaleaceae bacterium]